MSRKLIQSRIANGQFISGNKLLFKKSSENNRVALAKAADKIRHCDRGVSIDKILYSQFQDTLYLRQTRLPFLFAFRAGFLRLAINYIDQAVPIGVIMSPQLPGLSRDCNVWHAESLINRVILSAPRAVEQSFVCVACLFTTLCVIRLSNEREKRRGGGRYDWPMPGKCVRLCVRVYIWERRAQSQLRNSRARTVPLNMRAHKRIINIPTAVQGKLFTHV